MGGIKIRPPVVRLDWTIRAENCSQAILYHKTLACRDDKSVCVDVADDPSIMRGYMCRCVQGYEGNPYLRGGCKPISFSSSIAKPGCQDQCGRLSIPFPFGVGKNCYLAPNFEIICNSTNNPPKAYLRVLNKEIIELNSSRILVNYPNLGLACYNLSNYQRGITKTEEHSLIIDLSKTQYTLSGENWITTIGCDDMVVGSIRQGNRSFISSGCSTVCSDNVVASRINGYCPYRNTRSTGYLPGDGCCEALVPRGTSYLEANLTDLSGQLRRRKFFSCSYAFLKFRSNGFSYRFDYLNNSTAAPPVDPIQDRSWRETIMALDWRIGALNCKEARLNTTNFACQSNSDCIDFDATIGGYLCSCSNGYQGNPYLSHGCQDINECDDNTTNPCNSNSICINTPGSFHCSCPKGYYGDGRNEGKGCIQKQQTMTIIVIGIGSGFGFLLILLMCIWFYKVLQNRKEQFLKDKFFKRNGGLLLQQQTNEGVIGQTKVFLVKELEVATDHFNESRILGQGGQGTVYKGMLSDGKIVAIKRSKLVGENQLEQFINEVVILSQINHKNVVKLLGCCLETEVPLLVYEFMPNGTLSDLIHDPNNEFPLTWNARLKIATDIAGALAYLHSASSIPIFHRDIKSSNIILDEKYVIKISDFGISRSIAKDQTHLTTMVKGTFGYLDPEYFQSSQFTEKSDVYSFGVVLVELLTGQIPLSLDKRDEERSLATRFLRSIEENSLEAIIDTKVLEQGRKEDLILVARLAQRCLNLQGRMRPTMKEVATELESLRICQMSIGVNDEFEEVRGFEDMPTLMISDINQYTWTSNSRSGTALTSDVHPLIFTTE
ncbi:hypothetical protein C2S52_001877 [Perilla frutescens var. hirtella]|nr:hypothetical protein C2S52_001877 [Perilla frutescens var. hirtella]